MKERRKAKDITGLLKRIEKSGSSLFKLRLKGELRQEDHYIEGELRKLCEGTERDIEAILGIRDQDLSPILRQVHRDFDYKQELARLEAKGAYNPKHDMAPSSKVLLLAGLEKAFNLGQTPPLCESFKVTLLPLPQNYMQWLRFLRCGLGPELREKGVITNEKVLELKAEQKQGDSLWIASPLDWALCLTKD